MLWYAAQAYPFQHALVLRLEVSAAQVAFGVHSLVKLQTKKKKEKSDTEEKEGCQSC